MKEADSNVKSRVNIATSNMRYVVDWTKHVTETDGATIEHEIDAYLKDPLLAIKDQKGDDLAAEDVIERYKSFDILQWWKNAASRYPILSALAKDIFAIQVSTVASESAFSTEGRVIDSFRSSLTHKSVEALICMQNWLRGDDIVMDFENEPSAQELEFYENIETELYNVKMIVGDKVVDVESLEDEDAGYDDWN
ncbi:Zinc finger BED domain-containing protein DAYSLEEPER [Striga hermonthica]|uniref:Zinc finger BED domain-containing protein DAYSLEEPER n=1 Tax=Striga hermonthica TaxID=68872 RepID=A0A9N7RHR8_STRHE|nr:Zinc finger BED domain-containing protein DAYSLEEPER [Striga hermonthica]